MQYKWVGHLKNPKQIQTLQLSLICVDTPAGVGTLPLESASGCGARALESSTQSIWQWPFLLSRIEFLLLTFKMAHRQNKCGLYRHEESGVEYVDVSYFLFPSRKSSNFIEMKLSCGMMFLLPIVYWWFLTLTCTGGFSRQLFTSFKTGKETYKAALCY